MTIEQTQHGGYQPDLEAQNREEDRGWMRGRPVMRVYRNKNLMMVFGAFVSIIGIGTVSAGLVLKASDDSSELHKRFFYKDLGLYVAFGGAIVSLLGAAIMRNAERLRE